MIEPDLLPPPAGVLPLVSGPGVARHGRWLLLVAAGLLLVSFYHRVLHIDEAWIGEQAYWAAKEGAVRSELFRGLLGAETRQLVYHWLFVWQGAAVIKLAGWSVGGLRLIGLAYLGVFLLLSHRHLRRHYFESQAGLRLFYILLLSNALLAEYAYMFRPEVMLMTLGFGSWLALERSYFGRGKLAEPGPAAGQVRYAALAGLLAGAAALTHLNGLVFIGAGAGLLLRRHRHRVGPLLAFGLAAAAAFSIYWLDLWRLDAWEAYLRQLAPAGPQPAPEGANRLWTYAGHVLSEHRRFFHSPVEAALTLLTGAAARVLHRAAPASRRRADLLLYLLLLVAAVAALTPGKTTKYMLLYLPYPCLLIALAFEARLTRPRRLAALLPALLAGYLLINFGYTGYLISRHDDQPARSRALARRLAPARPERLLAPPEFIFPEIENYTIQSVTCYAMLQKAGRLPSGEAAFFAAAARFRRQLIILDDNSLKVLGLRPPVAGRTYGRYRYQYQFQRYYVYEAL